VVETSLQLHQIRAGFPAALLATFTSQLISSRAHETAQFDGGPRPAIGLKTILAALPPAQRKRIFPVGGNEDLIGSALRGISASSTTPAETRKPSGKWRAPVLVTPSYAQLLNRQTISAKAKGSFRRPQLPPSYEWKCRA
jgi:hypothetical protein